MFCGVWEALGSSDESVARDVLTEEHARDVLTDRDAREVLTGGPAQPHAHETV